MIHKIDCETNFYDECYLVVNGNHIQAYSSIDEIHDVLLGNIYGNVNSQLYYALRNEIENRI